MKEKDLSTEQIISINNGMKLIGKHTLPVENQSHGILCFKIKDYVQFYVMDISDFKKLIDLSNNTNTEVYLNFNSNEIIFYPKVKISKK
jgi:hypothetical protein